MPTIHELADVQSEQIGKSTRIWQFAVILAGAVVGECCDIGAHTFIENGVIIGNGVTIKPGVQIRAGIEIADNVFIGPNVVFASDSSPDSRQCLDSPRHTIICKGASIGAGAVILPDVVIGERAKINAGAVVARSVPSNAIVDGNPARIVGYIDTSTDVSATLSNVQLSAFPVGMTKTKVTGVTIHHFPYIPDIRGGLTVGEFEKTVPFTPKRYFLVLDVPSLETRGEHAHRKNSELLICVRGSCAVVVDDGMNRQEFQLDRTDIGIFLPPMVWRVHYKHSSDAVLLVFASHYYDPDDYIRDYSEFRRILGVAT